MSILDSDAQVIKRTYDAIKRRALTDLFYYDL